MYKVHLPIILERGSGSIYRKKEKKERLLEPTIYFNLQVTLEPRFRKSLAHERLQSNLEFRYQFIVSSIKFRKGFVKFMIPIALCKKILS